MVASRPQRALHCWVVTKRRVGPPPDETPSGPAPIETPPDPPPELEEEEERESPPPDDSQVEPSFLPPAAAGEPAPAAGISTTRSTRKVVIAVILGAVLVVAAMGYAGAGYAFSSSRLDGARNLTAADYHAVKVRQGVRRRLGERVGSRKG